MAGLSSKARAAAYRPEAIKVCCEGCMYEGLCIYRRVVEDAVRGAASELRTDDWSPGDDPVVTVIDIRACTLYNAT